MEVEEVVAVESFVGLVEEGPCLEEVAEVVVVEVEAVLAWLESVTLSQVAGQHWFEPDENLKVWPSTILNEQ